MKITKCNKLHAEKCREDFMKFCENTGINPCAIVGYKRSKSLSIDRALVYKYLREQGYSFPVIGETLNRDHSTIQYLLFPIEIRRERALKAKIRFALKNGV